MKKSHRIGLSVLWTAILFTFLYLIRTAFEVSFWKPFLIFLLILSAAAAVCLLLPRRLPPKFAERIRHILSLYHRAENTFYSLFSDRTLFFQLWLILSLLYIPAYIALFPGTFGYDGPVQMAQYFGDTELTSHHPLMHTWLMGLFLSLGDGLFKSYTAGFALYTALQGLAVTASLSCSLVACRRHRVPLIWIIVGALWAGINPFLQTLTFSSTKDILFGAFLLCFTVSFLDLLECDSPGRGHFIRLCVFGVLMCLFRNQGIYILLALLLVCLLLRVRRKEAYVCVTIAYLIPQIFFVESVELLHIPQGDAREMLCVPMQQMARICNFHIYGDPVSIDSEQYSIVSELIPEEGLLLYTPNSADPVKGHFRTDVLNEDFGKYLSTYVSLGLQNPREYLAAWAEMVQPYLDMSKNEYRALSLTYTFPDTNHWEIEHAQIFYNYYTFLYQKIQTADYNIFWRPETCLWLLAGLSGLAIALKRKNILLCLAPLALYFGTILLGPVALLRYLFPLTLATPMLLGLLFQRGRKRQALQHRRQKAPAPKAPELVFTEV